jgi:hypothetical protein
MFLTYYFRPLILEVLRFIHWRIVWILLEIGACFTLTWCVICWKYLCVILAFIVSESWFLDSISSFSIRLNLSFRWINHHRIPLIFILKWIYIFICHALNGLKSGYFYTLILGKEFFLGFFSFILGFYLADTATAIVLRSYFLAQGYTSSYGKILYSIKFAFYSILII